MNGLDEITGIYVGLNEENIINKSVIEWTGHIEYKLEESVMLS